MDGFWGLGGDLGRSWGSSWEVLGDLEGSFRGLGGSWAALGGVLEGLGTVLDRSWVVLGRNGLLRVMLDPTGPRDQVEKGGPSGGKMRSKWGSRRSKIEAKNEVEKRCS